MSANRTCNFVHFVFATICKNYLQLCTKSTCKKHLGIRNVKNSEYTYLDSSTCKSWNVDSRKYDEYYIEIKARLSNIDDEIKSVDENVISKIKDKKHKVISGKNYLASLKKYLRNFTDVQIIDKDFKNILLMNFDIKKLNFIKQRIDTRMSNQRAG